MSGTYCTGCRDEKEGAMCKLGYIKRIVELNTTQQGCWRESPVGDKGVAGTGKIIKLGGSRMDRKDFLETSEVRTDGRTMTVGKPPAGWGKRGCAWAACIRWRPKTEGPVGRITNARFNGPCGNYIYP